MSHEIVVLDHFQMEERLQRIDELLNEGYKVAFVATLDVNGTPRPVVYLHKREYPEIPDVTVGTGMPYRVGSAAADAFTEAMKKAGI